jgi:hypothetical protein
MSSARRVQWVSIAFVVIAIELVAWNLYVLQRNQRRFAADDKPVPTSRNIAAVAARNWYAPIKYTFALWQRLRVLEGATLIVPESMRGQPELGLGRVSRLTLEFAPPLEMPAATFARLNERATYRGNLETQQLVSILVDPAARRYVWATVPDNGPVMILPEALYRAEVPTTLAAPSVAP